MKTDILNYFKLHKCITMLYVNIKECIEIVVYVKRSTVSHYQKAIEILSVRNSPHLGQDI